VPYVHLNWGDAGLKRFFRRCFLELKSGGRFIVEVEGFDWYRRRYRKLSDQSKRVFESIKLFPANFHTHLLSEEAGFSHQEEIDTGTPVAREMGKPHYPLNMRLDFPVKAGLVDYWFSTRDALCSVQMALQSPSIRYTSCICLLFY